MENRDIPWGAVEGVGVGVPGPVDDEGTVFKCVNLDWGMFNIPAVVQKLEPGLRRVKVSNDVNAAALGELWKGQKLNVTVTPRMVQITGEKQKEPVTLEVWGQEYDFQEELVVIKKFES